jgi:hypothetical protein
LEIVILTGIHPDEKEYSIHVSTWMEKLLLQHGACINTPGAISMPVYPFSQPSGNRLYTYSGFYFNLNRVFAKRTTSNRNDLKKAVDIIESYCGAPNDMARYFIDACFDMQIDVTSITHGGQSYYNGFFGFSNSHLRRICMHEIRRIGDEYLTSYRIPKT